MPRLDAAAVVIGGALNTSGLGRVLLAGALAELPEAIIAELTTKICDASLSGRLGQATVECAPRRRTRGLLQAVFSRVLIPTADWSKPCGDTERVTARAASGRSSYCSTRTFRMQKSYGTGVPIIAPGTKKTFVRCVGSKVTLSTPEISGLCAMASGPEKTARASTDGTGTSR